MRSGRPSGRRRARPRSTPPARNGIVAVHECAGPDISGREDLRELLAFEHGVAVRAYWGVPVNTPEQARTLLAETGAHGLAGDLFVDGSLGSRTAWLHEPYTDAPSETGNAYLDADGVADHVRACTHAGIQAGFHVIGDAAVAAAVEGIGRVVDELGGPAVAACGHRLEHVEMITGEQASKLGAWGVIASVQPGFDAAWGGPDGLYARRLGSDRAAAMNPFAQLAAAGVSLALGSDAPVTALDPWAAVRAAAHHRTPGSGISPRAAFAAATRGAWRAGGVRDGVAGTLVPGAPGSYAVWEVDELVVSAPTESSATSPRCNAGRPIRAPGCHRCRGSTRMPPSPRCLRTVRDGQTIYAS